MLRPGVKIAGRVSAIRESGEADVLVTISAPDSSVDFTVTFYSLSEQHRTALFKEVPS